MIKTLHNNFGWGGSAKGDDGTTGWYNSGVFNTNNGKQFNSNAFKNGEDRNFQFHNNLLIDIY